MQSVSTERGQETENARHWEPGIGGCLLILGALLGLVTIGPAAVYLVWSRAAAQRVDEQLAELRAQDQPTTPEELAAYYAYPPEGEDVTPLLLAALREIDTPEFQAAARDLPVVGTSEREIPPPGQTWEDLDAARALLDRYSDSLRKLHDAADAGGAARFPIDFDEGFGLSLEHMQQLRAAARLLRLEAQVLAAEGDAAGAARSTRALLSLARSPQNEPLLVSQLVSYACQGVAHGLVSDLLPHIDFSDQDLAMLQREIRRAEIAEGARRALKGERVLGIDAIRHPNKLGDEEGSTMAFRPWMHEDLAFYIETMNRYVEASEEPWPEAQALADDIEQDLQQEAGGSAIQQMRYTMSGKILPATTAMLAAAAQVDGAGRVVDTAIAVERYRRQAGQAPRSLEALVPKYLPVVPSDPFSGRPLRYLLNDGEIVIYSIGRDAVDDGGQGDIGGNPDIVIRLPRQ